MNVKILYFRVIHPQKFSVPPRNVEVSPKKKGGGGGVLRGNARNTFIFLFLSITMCLGELVYRIALLNS